jgi:hypothetical protein
MPIPEVHLENQQRKQHQNHLTTQREFHIVVHQNMNKNKNKNKVYHHTQNQTQNLIQNQNLNLNR